MSLPLDAVEAFIRDQSPLVRLFRSQGIEPCFEPHVGRKTKTPIPLTPQAQAVKNAKHRATNKASRLRRERRTPEWADRQLISAFYIEAARLTRETGLVHHVDHIVPLRGRMVSGLHCQFNLRVCTGAENMAKSNKHKP